MALGAAMLVLGGAASSQEAARTMMADAISSGRALLKLEEIISAQGGDSGVVRDRAVFRGQPIPRRSSRNAKG